MNNWIITINCLDETHTPKTLYFSDNGYVSREGIYYSKKLNQPAKIAVYGNDGGLLNVIQQTSIGDIELNNTDGSLNNLANYAFGRDCVVQFVENDNVTTWIKGIVTRVNHKNNVVTLTLKTLSEALDLPLNQARYSGTNIDNSGVEGFTNDIMGQVKPRCYGRVYNATPVVCNNLSKIYQISDLNTTTVTNVYDKGGEISKGITWTTLSDLINHEPTVGTFDSYKGYFKISPYTTVSEVTCDTYDSTYRLGDIFNKVIESVAIPSGMRLISELPVLLDSENYIYQISSNPAMRINDVYNDGTKLKFGVERSSDNLTIVAPEVGTYDTYQGKFRINPPLQSEIGFSGAYEPIMLGVISCDATNTGVAIDSTYNLSCSYTTINLLNLYGEAGLFLNNETTVREVLDRIVRSIGAYWWIGQESIFDGGFNLNTVNVAIYETSGYGEIGVSINEWQIDSKSERSSTGIGKNGVPYYSVVANYAKIETVQKDVIGYISNDRRARLLRPYLTVESSDITVKDIHPQSTKLTFDSLLVNTEDIQFATDRLLMLISKRCDVLNLIVYFNKLPSLTLDTNVEVFYSRLGYKNGAYFKLVGFEIDVKRKIVNMQLIGYAIYE